MDFAPYIVPVIAGICFLGSLCFKQVVKSDRAHDFIPTGCAVVGVALAAWIDSIAGNPVTPTTILVGMASGLSATGAWEAVTHWKGASSEG